MKKHPLLADIGNTHIHIYNGLSVEHLEYAEAIELYADKRIQYICVNQKVELEIQKSTLWQNISSLITLKGAYSGMGVDRKALCLAYDNALLVDAGSAITIDIMENGRYKGGFILAGLKATLQSYASISPVLESTLQKDISLNTLPTSTREGISYGVIAPIIAIIQKHQEDKKVYFTGGDGEYLSRFLPNSSFDDRAVFYGMLTKINS